MGVRDTKFLRDDFEVNMIKDALIEQYRSSSNLEARILLHERFSVAKRRWPLWGFDQLDFSSHSKILELGCGPGRLWTLNRERIGKGWSAVLSDFSQGMIEKARANLVDVNGAFDFAVLEAGDIPFGDGRFDVVIANHMLYHVPHVGRTLGEIRRVLRPHGVLYASTNGVQHMADLDELMPEGLPFKPVGEVIQGFTLENGTEALRPLFREVELRRHKDGLVVTEVRPLVDYALSRLSIFADTVLIDDSARQRFEEKVARKMDEAGGAVRIRKDSGLFIARK
jgi:SAM-dependent methyltransferase